MYGPLRDLALFNQVRIDTEVDTLVWPNGADFYPQLNDLLEAAAEIGRPENRPPEDVLKDALDHYRRSRELKEITNWGTKHSKSRGLKPSDVEREVNKDHAQQNRGR